MARMIPEVFPRPDDPKRKGEHKVFDVLRDRLPNDYTVFYSFEVIREKRKGKFAESETDFLVFHEDQGFLGIEVKGGNVKVGVKDGEIELRIEEPGSRQIGSKKPPLLTAD